MSKTPETLAPGDIIEIKYRLWRAAGSGADHVIERWITARIIACEPNTRPLARLADGQVTEIRDFMSWRLVARGRDRRHIAEAA